MSYTFELAGKGVTGFGLSTILKAIECGGIDATNNLFGNWKIEYREPRQTYLPSAASADQDAPQATAAPEAPHLEAEMAALIKAAEASLRQPDADPRDADAFHQPAIDPNRAGERTAAPSKNIEFEKYRVRRLTNLVRSSAPGIPTSGSMIRSGLRKPARPPASTAPMPSLPRSWGRARQDGLSGCRPVLPLVTLPFPSGKRSILRVRSRFPRITPPLPVPRQAATQAAACRAPARSPLPRRAYTVIGPVIRKAPLNQPAPSGRPLRRSRIPDHRNPPPESDLGRRRCCRARCHSPKPGPPPSRAGRCAMSPVRRPSWRGLMGPGGRRAGIRCRGWEGSS